MEGDPVPVRTMQAPAARWAGRLWVPLAVGLGYAAGSLIALSWFDANGLGPTFFPSAGVTLGALVLIERRRWPPVLAAVAIAELVLDVTHDLSVRNSLGYVVANTVEPFTGAYLITRQVGRADLARRRDLFAFLGFGVLAAPAVGGVIAATAYVIGGGAILGWPEFAVRWWLGDGLGILVVGGAILGWRSEARPAVGRLTAPSAIALVGISWVSVTAVFYWRLFPLAFLPMVILIMIAFRLGTPGVTVAGAGMAFVVAQAVASGREFWTRVGVSPTTGWVYVQVLIGVMITVALILAVEIREREQSLLERDRGRAMLGLHNAVAAMASATTQDEVLAAVIGPGLAATGARAAAVALRTGDGGFDLVASTGLIETELPMLRQPSGDKRWGRGVPLGDAVHRGRPVLLTGLAAVAASYPDALGTLRRTGDAAWAAIPFPLTSPLRGGMFLSFAAPQRFGTDQLALLSTLAETAGQALGRTRAHASEREARRRAEVLSRVSAGLEQVETSAERMQRLVELLVPDLADFATVELPGQDGRPHLVAATHADPRQVKFVLAARRRWAIGPDQSRGVAHVLATGRSELAETVPQSLIEEYFTDAEAQALILALAPLSYLAVPLTARGDVIAALLMAQAGSGRHFSTGDLSLAEEIAARAALALDNARLHEREHQVAVELQTAMLPEAPAQVGGVQIAARYRAAEEHLQVGGDWYDTIPLPDGRIGVIIGDVVGHSLHAATAMGQLRTAADALALSADGPADLLGRLEGFAERITAAAMSTLCYLDLDPATGLVRYASAGHPPPVLLAPGLPLRLLEAGRSAPLCARSGEPRTEATISLAPGSTIVLYTDGLIERRQESLDTGLSRLISTLKAHRDLEPEPLADVLIEHLLGGEPPPDDIALVCLRYQPAPVPGPAERPWTPSGGRADNRP